MANAVCNWKARRVRPFLRNEFHFSEVYCSVNYIGSRAKCINLEGAHVNFAGD